MMNRAGSFASSSQISLRSGLGEKDGGAGKVSEEDPRVIYLKSKGRLPLKTISPTVGGRLLTFCNYPVRNRQWAMEAVTVHPSAAAFVLADERGQLFYMSMDNSIYQSVRLASSKVTALCFLPSKAQVMVAYENGSNIIVDAATTDIVGNFQFPFTYGGVRMISAGPDGLAAMVQGPYTVVLWDSRTARCTETLECPEVIIELSFELSGKYIAVTLERSGVFLYSTASFALAAQLTTDIGRATWSATVCVTHKNYWQTEKTLKTYLQVLMAASDGRVFSGYLEDLAGAGVGAEQGLKCHSFVAFDLPHTMDGVLAMAYLGCAPSSASPRIALLGRSGDLLILQSERVHELSAGYLTIVADLPAEVVQSNGAALSTSPGAAGPAHSASQRSLHSLHSRSMATMPFVGRNYPERAVGRALMGACGEHLVVLGTDGAARLFKVEAMFGNTGSNLQHRRLNAYDPAGRDKENSRSSRRVVESDASSVSSPDLHHHRSHGHARSAHEIKDTLHDYYLGPDEKNAKSKMGTSTASNKGKQKVSPASSISASASARSPRSPRAARAVVTGTVPSFISGAKNKQHKGIDLSTTPLFALAALTPKERRINQIKLRAFLEKHGEYPSRYRPLIWRFLLKLPENSLAFADLVSRGVHPLFEELDERYPIPQRKLFNRLQNTCSQLAHWAPIVGEAPYLPAMVFPFLLIYGADELAALETVMSIYMYWGISWHSAHPNPPLNLLNLFGDLLKLHEIKLYEHLVRYNIPPGVLAWQMLSTVFSEVCSRSTWCKLMDHLLTDFEKLSTIYLMPIAILKDLKGALLTADTEQKIIAVVRQQADLQLLSVLNHCKDMASRTPDKYFMGIASKYLNPQNFEVDKNKPLMMNGRADAELEATEDMMLSNGRPLHPLPSGHYPAYDGIPQSVQDVQIRERNRVMSLSKEVQRRENVLKKLERKISDTNAEHSNFMKKHAHLSTYEINHRREMMEQEKSYLYELQRIEEEISLQRIRALDSLQVISQEEIDIMDRVVADSKQMMEENEKHMKEKTTIQIALQKHRELAEKAEHTAMEKMRVLRLMRSRDDWVKGLNGMLTSKEEELSAKDQLIAEQWRQEDETRKLHRQTREAELRKAAEIDKLSAVQSEITNNMRILHLQREAKLKEIERSRAIRLAQEQANDALEAAERAVLFAKKQDIMSTTNAPEGLSSAPLREAEARLAETVQFIQAESNKLLDAEKIYSLKARKAEQTLQQAAAQKAMADDIHELQAARVQEAEASLQQQARALQQASYSLEARGTTPKVKKASAQWASYPSSEVPVPAAGAGVGYGFGAPAVGKSKVIDLEEDGDESDGSDGDMLLTMQEANARASRALLREPMLSDEEEESMPMAATWTHQTHSTSTASRRQMVTTVSGHSTSNSDEELHFLPTQPRQQPSKARKQSKQVQGTVDDDLDSDSALWAFEPDSPSMH